MTTPLDTFKAALLAIFNKSGGDTASGAAGSIGDAISAYHLAVPGGGHTGTGWAHVTNGAEDTVVSTPSASDVAAIPTSILTAVGTLITASGASVPATVAAGPSGSYLRGNGAAAPTWEDHVGAYDPHTQYAMKSQSPWHEIGAYAQPVFENNWVNFSVSEETAAFMKDSMGFVHLKGLVKSGTAGPIFTLPAGYTPVANPIFTVPTNNGINWLFGGIQVAADGKVYFAVGSNTWVSLACIYFRAA